MLTSFRKTKSNQENFAFWFPLALIIEKNDCISNKCFMPRRAQEKAGQKIPPGLVILSVKRPFPSSA
jgi:hypothetical protein